MTRLQPVIRFGDLVDDPTRSLEWLASSEAWRLSILCERCASVAEREVSLLRARNVAIELIVLEFELLLE